MPYFMYFNDTVTTVVSKPAPLLPVARKSAEGIQLQLLLIQRYSEGWTVMRKSVIHLACQGVTGLPSWSCLQHFGIKKLSQGHSSSGQTQECRSRRTIPSHCS
ncbi:hypothetical protein MHYP_G00141990 [Metynnis hypsauchen]